MNLIISKLSPAETLLLRDGDKVTVRELLKYTLMDLLLKQVLEIQYTERQAHARDPVRQTKYIATGKNFGTYRPLRHEFPFMTGFVRKGDTMLFRNCVQVAYENTGTKTDMHTRIRATPMMKEVFSNSIFHRIFNLCSYTDEGLKLKTTVTNELSTIERDLSKLLANEKAKALELLKHIGGNIFLIRGVDFAILKEIDEAFSERSEFGGGGGCGAGCGSTWIDFDSHGHDFDSSCSSHSSSHSGGCSGGDSGCSGDGGCSGCGGCGGD
jgi:hypothetical protein